MKQSFGRGCPVIYHSILLYFILSMAVVAKLHKCILLEFAPIMPVFCSLLLPSYFSKNYAGKIGASLLASYRIHGIFGGGFNLGLVNYVNIAKLNVATSFRL